MKKSTVSIWQEQVIIPTYGTGKPNKNPMFFENRIYQGSSGVVYPNPVIEKILDEKEDKSYIGLFLENDYLKIMILPELGGRIQMAYDKIKQRHFVYYNQVIKPALVGLTGPWISGGIEFNWPQHHRPSTFDPIDFTMESHVDGSKTVWLNEIEQMFHTKGMAGFTLYPDKAYIEIKAKLFNRTDLPQTFLWWANPAVKVNDHYQSVFPPDVNAVFDHGKRDVSAFPIATGTYYKVNYAPGTDISRYKNIPVPTSYMAINSEYDFVGGYEHDSKGGLLHVANHHVSPGKKQWTWGNGDFGKAWDRNLTDEDGPYIELMTGMFTDNQPDFTWIMPNEEKSFTQYFLPYSELGMVKNASKDILLAINKVGDGLELKIYATAEQPALEVKLNINEKVFWEEKISVSPENVYVKVIALDQQLEADHLLLLITKINGEELLRYDTSTYQKNILPEPAKPALRPEDIESNEQLFLTGQHLEQYRHATYSPLPYYEKALKQEPGDIRNNNALGLWYLRHGQFKKSEGYFRKAMETSSAGNPNPYDTEPYYNLGLCLRFLRQDKEAYDAFYKSSWGNAWKAAGYFAVAQLDVKKGNYEQAITHVSIALDSNANNSKAYVVKSASYRKLNLPESAISIALAALNRDVFNLGALFECNCACKVLGDHEKAKYYQDELRRLSRGYEQNFMEYAIDYMTMGLYSEAIDLVSYAIKEKGTSPLVYYYLAFFQAQIGEEKKVDRLLQQAERADSYLCFPNRLEEIELLEFAISKNPLGAKAPYYLGNLFYDKRQYQEAITYWESSADLDRNFPTVWRNLGIAYFNKVNDAGRALTSFETAFKLDPTDDRLLMELHQFYLILNYSPKKRLLFLERHLPVVEERDDVYLERVILYNIMGEHERALDLLMNRKFHPWEGGEGKVSGQYVFSLVQLARIKIESGAFQKAIELLEQAQVYPYNLGEGKLFGLTENDVFYFMGCAYEGLNNEVAARNCFNKACLGADEPSAAIFYNDQEPDQIFYKGLALIKLGETETAKRIFDQLISYANQHINDPAQIDYFAVSLPTLSVFEDNLKVRNKVHCYFIKGLGLLGSGAVEEANEVFQKVCSLNSAHIGALYILK
ncbi:DUF5107 domain-containing protein [Pedobacter gandavensis]|uniref:DUF5107 domain-containing protein n=1 Tax=Pedobacter gandavensis TaxID=2679963 RepID=A0ABR6EQR0_9SPHI|nr:DUF5107 domain-containing protein [Pedobacter gandavensis]MBB2147585.1 DUF5107 domain-containing protein [Pedobacter gandavensis]